MLSIFKQATYEKNEEEEGEGEEEQEEEQKEEEEGGGGWVKQVFQAREGTSVAYLRRSGPVVKKIISPWTSWSP